MIHLRKQNLTAVILTDWKVGVPPVNVFKPLLMVEPPPEEEPVNVIVVALVWCVISIPEPPESINLKTSPVESVFKKLVAPVGEKLSDLIKSFGTNTVLLVDKVQP